jgi:EAL domain-containing protein (putative c-di-GMP-specific phosphodiesterase class I)
VRRTGFDPRRLILEVTESSMVEGEQAVGQLARLRDAGIRIALDDFGSGYSSLRYLTRLPVDILKLDRSFVSELDGTPSGSAVAAAMLRLGEALHLQTVAEGVESASQAQELTLLGCQLAQGFHFAHPMPADALQTLLDGITRTQPQPSAPQH